jgi:hypothetical protein
VGRVRYVLRPVEAGSRDSDDVGSDAIGSDGVGLVDIGFDGVGVGFGGVGFGFDATDRNGWDGTGWGGTGSDVRTAQTTRPEPSTLSLTPQSLLSMPTSMSPRPPWSSGPGLRSAGRVTPRLWSSTSMWSRSPAARSLQTIHSLAVWVSALVTSSEATRTALSHVSVHVPHSLSSSRTFLRATPTEAGAGDSPNTPALWGCSSSGSRPNGLG